MAGRFTDVEVWTAPSTACQFAPGAWLPGSVLEGSGYRIFELDGDCCEAAVRRVLTRRRSEARDRGI